MYQNELQYGTWKIVDLYTLLFEISSIHGSVIFEELYDLLNNSGLLIEGRGEIRAAAQSVINILGRSGKGFLIKLHTTDESSRYFKRIDFEIISKSSHCLPRSH